MDRDIYGHYPPRTVTLDGDDYHRMLRDLEHSRGQVRLLLGYTDHLIENGLLGPSEHAELFQAYVDARKQS